MKRRVLNWILAGLSIVLVVVVAVWASDRVTWQGERTIFTVTCVQGAWEGNRCTGKLAPGPRYAFRASPTRKEVLYWVRYSNEPSGKYSNCVVRDRDNWSCPTEPGQRPSIATELKDGHPNRGAEGLMHYHAVPKWKWWLIEAGIGIFSEAGR